MEVAPHMMKPVYVNLFEILTSAQFDEECRVFMKDLDGRYIYANTAFARDSGLNSDLILGATDNDTAWSSMADTLRDEDSQVIATGTHSYQKRLIPTRRRRLLVYVRKCALYDERMRPCGVVGLYRSVEDQMSHRGDCAGCNCIEPTIRSLNVALSLLSPEQMREYEEQMQLQRGEADELELS